MEKLQIKYVGPKDFKTVNGQRFYRLKPASVSDAVALRLLSDPLTFLPADEEVPAETLAQREKLADALVKAGEEHVSCYTQIYYEVKAWPSGKIDEATGKPDAKEQRKQDSLKGAQEEIDHGKKLIAEGEAWRAKVAAEQASESAKRGSGRPRQETEA